MNPIFAQQVTLDNALVALEKRLKIEKCNMRIEFSKPHRETTYQVTLDNTIKKIKDTDAYRFKLDKQKFQIDTEVFHKVLQICPRLLNQDFVEHPSDEEMVPFIKELRCISGKSISFDRLRPSRAQMLWEMFYKKNVNFVDLLWEDFMFQADNRDISPARKENMPYPRFTKMINLAIKDSKEYKIYFDFATRKATPKKARKFKKITSPLMNPTLILEEEPAKKPKRAKHPKTAKKPKPTKKTKIAKKTALSKKSSTMQRAGVVIRDTLGVSVSKKKAPAKVDRGKGMDLLSDVALLEAV
ncbi:hypothetical protein Tco_0902949 [Tanacetum coccineum]